MLWHARACLLAEQVPKQKSEQPHEFPFCCSFLFHTIGGAGPCKRTGITAAVFP